MMCFLGWKSDWVILFGDFIVSIEDKNLKAILFKKESLPYCGCELVIKILCFDIIGLISSEVFENKVYPH